MNSSTYGDILQLESSGGFSLFPPNSLPGTLFNRPISFSEFMPDVGAGTVPIVFGDFSYYWVADRHQLRVQRLAERFAPNVGLLATARYGGQPVRSNAFRTQTVST